MFSRRQSKINEDAQPWNPYTIIKAETTSLVKKQTLYKIVYCCAQAVSGQFLCYSTAIIQLHTAALPGSLWRIYKAAQYPNNMLGGFRWAQCSNFNWIWDALTASLTINYKALWSYT